MAQALIALSDLLECGVICALLVDPDDSPDFPGGTAEVMGRPLAAYPLLAAKGSRHVGRIYAQTASPAVARASAQFGAVGLIPPAANEAKRLSDEVLIAHGYRQMADDLRSEKAEAELVVILFANTGTVNTTLIDEGIEALLENPKLDSAATVSAYNRWTPRRAFRETPDKRLAPYVTHMPETAEPLFPDWGAVVARPKILEAMTAASLPLSYLGKTIHPLKQIGGGPVDYHWQVPKLEYWLKKQGVRDTGRPEPIPKPKLKPKERPDRR